MTQLVAAATEAAEAPARLRVGVRVPAQLRSLAEGRRIVDVEVPAPATAGDVLRAMQAAYPGLHHAALDERGKLRQHVNVFVGVENVRACQGLATPVPDRVELSIIPAVSGG